jgi:hypothetical protein
MNTRLIAGGIAVAIGLAVLAGTMACSSGGGLSLEEYFAQVEQLSDEMQTAGDDAQNELDEQLATAESTEELIELLDQFLTTALAVAGDFSDSMSDIDPPSEVSDLHQQTIDSFDEGITALEEVQGDLQDVETEAELQEFSTDVGQRFDELDAETEETCNGLQEIADENEIDVDLQCGE